MSITINFCLQSEWRRKMPEKKEAPSLVFWVTIIGIAVSIALSVLPIFLNQSLSLGLLIGLVSIAGTLLLDFGIRFTETRNNFSERVASLESEIATLLQKEGEDIKRAIKLGDHLARDTEIRRTIEMIVNVCEDVKSLNVDVFTRKVDEYLTNCYARVNDLADGEEVLDSEFSFLPAEHSQDKSMASIVISSDPHFLDTILGRRLLDAWRDSIKRNRDVTLLWIQEKQILSNQKFHKLVQEQQKIGIHVLIAEKETVPPHLQKDYGIIDRRYFYISEIVNGKPEREKVSNNQDELRKLAEEFSRLKTFSENSSMYYSQLSQNIHSAP